MNYLIPFSELNKNDISLAGGKGANLGELTTAGLPVPAGFVLTTAAYDAFVQSNGLQEQIMTLANTVSAADPASSQHASVQIRALFRQAELSTEIATALVAAYAGLNNAAVAVRSSATAEDLPTASFAGQQDSYLNVHGEAALLEAVKNCWASLWTARAIAYRQRQGIAPDVVSLAVVVQRLVAADVSGILFTANPMSGERDQVLINATWGLGEAIVGGLVTPDTVVIHKNSRAVVSRETAEKRVMTTRTDGGTAEQAVPAAQQSMPALDDETALQLADFGTKIEAHYGMPMDIEWTLTGGEIAIVQARPITSLPPEPLKDVSWEPLTPETLWMRRQIVEHMPEPLSPLFEDVYIDKGLKWSIDQLMEAMEGVAGAKFNLDVLMPHGFAGTINGYAYTTASVNMNAPTFFAVLKLYTRIFKFINMPAFDWDGVVLPRYQALIGRWGSIDLAEAADEVLLQGIQELGAEDSNYWFGSAANLGLSRMLDQAFDRLLKSFLFRRGLPRPGMGSASFLRGFDSKALDAQADMEAIAGRILAVGGLRQLTQETAAGQLIDTLAAHPAGRPIVDDIQQYLNQYGHQIYNLDFAAPTQNEDPLPMLLSLKALVDTVPDEDVRTRQAKMAAERDALVEQTRRSLNPVSRRLFGWVWKWTKKYAPYREHVMFYMGAGWPTVRKLARELGERLTAAGTLTQPDDIYYLTVVEILDVIKQRDNGVITPDLTQLIAERRVLRDARQLLTPQPKVPIDGSLKFGPFTFSMFDPTPEGAGNDGPVLKGYAVSPGKIAAPASVIHSLEDFSEMRPNTILVCTTTTPAWTPLFSQAVGLVTDVGGALAHGSIVAREYGIPAVMGTGVATERIRSGMILVVDGDAGTVTLEDEDDNL